MWVIVSGVGLRALAADVERTCRLHLAGVLDGYLAEHEGPVRRIDFATKRQVRYEPQCA